jgi:hypothetical protein
MHLLKYLFVSLLGISWAMPVLAQRPSVGPGDCKPVERALEIHSKLKPGMTRGEVEKAFVLEGGIQFPNQARYAYRGCPFIKLVVEYQTSEDHTSTSADDKIKELSKLQLDYPTMD